jgi:hypothetical protein
MLVVPSPKGKPTLASPADKSKLTQDANGVGVEGTPLQWWATPTMRPAAFALTSEKITKLDLNWDR